MHRTSRFLVLAVAGFLATLALNGLGAAAIPGQEPDRLDRIGRRLVGILEKVDQQATEDRIAALREAKSELEALLTETREIYRGVSDRGGERERIEFHLRYLIRWTGYLLEQTGAEIEDPVSPAEAAYRRGLEQLEAARRHEREHAGDRVGIAERYLAALGLLRGRKEEREVLAHLNVIWAELDEGATGDEGVEPPSAGSAGPDPAGARPPTPRPVEGDAAARLPEPPAPRDPAAPSPTAADLKEFRRKLADGTATERIEAAQVIAGVDQSWVGDLLVQQLARENDPAVRVALTTEVVRVGNRHVVRALGKWARQEEPTRRQEAIEILGRIGGPEVGAALSEFANDPDEPTLDRLIQTAGRLPQGYGVPVLARVSKAQPEKRFEVIEALGRTGQTEAAKVLISFLHQKKFSEFKDPAVKALRMLGPPAIPPLIDALDGRDYRQYAAAALRSITGETLGISRSRWMQWWRENRKRLETTKDR